MVVIGGGVIGLELVRFVLPVSVLYPGVSLVSRFKLHFSVLISTAQGSVWSRLGAKVTVVEFLDRIAAGADGKIAYGQFRISSA